MLSEDMTQTDRERLAARLIREQRTRFSGVAKDAYIAAEVNSATWKRAVEAQSIKPHILVKIVTRLWPETEGDWRLIPGLAPASAGGPTSRRLVELIDGYQAQHPEVSDAFVADFIGVKARTIEEWRTRGIRQIPDPEPLQRLADLLGVDKRVTFYAAGVDSGYLAETPPIDPGIGDFTETA